MLEKWGFCNDKDKPFWALFTDLSKLQPYGFEIISLKLMLSYLTETKQRAKIGISYNSHRDIVFCVPQESILGPLLFNIFLCDLFLSMKDIDFANYADDNTTYSIRWWDRLGSINFRKCYCKPFQMVPRQSNETTPWKMTLRDK